MASISGIGAPLPFSDYRLHFSFNKLGLRKAEKSEVSVYIYRSIDIVVICHDVVWI